MPAQIPPAQGARARGDEEGSRELATAGGGGVRSGYMRSVPEVALGPPRETDHQYRSQGNVSRRIKKNNNKLSIILLTLPL